MHNYLVFLILTCLLMSFGASAQEITPPTSLAEQQYQKAMQYENGQDVTQSYQKAEQFYQQAAEKGYAPAQYALGQMYELGKGVKIDLPKAVTLYQQSSAQGYAKAQTALAMVYLWQICVELDMSEVLDLLTKAAQQGDAKAYSVLAIVYNSKTDGQYDRVRSTQYYQKAAELYQVTSQHDPYAAYALAELYEAGKGVPKDQEKARVLFKYASQLFQPTADQGNPEALYYLWDIKEKKINRSMEYGRLVADDQLISAAKKEYVPAILMLANVERINNLFLFENTRYIKKVGNVNKTSEIKYIKQLIALGSPLTLSEVGEAYFNGNQQERKKAIQLYQQAAKQCDLIAQLRLVPLYIEGKEVTRDYQQALQFMKRLASHNFSIMDVYQGLMYKYGLDVKQDYQKALQLFEKSVELGILERGFYEQALMYEAGEGVEQDYSQAAKLYQQAKSFRPSKYRLAYLYAKGLGVAKDISEASKLYYETIIDGVRETPNPPYSIGQYNKVSQDEYQKAIQFVSKAAELGNASAQYYLAKMYLYGSGKNKDPQQAIKFFKKAAQQGQKASRYELALMYDQGKYTTQDYSRAFHYYKDVAKSGGYIPIYLEMLYQLLGIIENKDQTIASAQYRLSILYELGLGTLKDEIAAIHWLKQAAKRGNRQALYRLGFKYEVGQGVEQSYEQAITYYQQADKKYSVNARYQLGKIYEVGKGVKRNYQRADQYYQNVGWLGVDARAQFALGKMYLHGTGVVQNKERGLLLLNEAAEKGLAKAHNYLGYFYKRQTGHQNKLLATKHYQLAARLYQLTIELNDQKLQQLLADNKLRCANDKNALLYKLVTLYEDDFVRLSHDRQEAFDNLSILYTWGFGVEKNQQRASELQTESLKLLQVFAEQGDPESKFYLGLAASDDDSMKENKKSAVNYYQQAIKQGYLPALSELSFMYELGLSVKEDTPKALKLYHEAADLGDAEAQNTLGYYYLKGTHVEQNIQKAHQYFEQAAAQGNTYAKTSLGLIYVNGIGVDPDYQHAVNLFTAAIDDQDAQAYLGLMYKQGLGVKQDYQHALKLFKQAQLKENEWAIYQLGLMYEKGEGVEQNYQEAAKLYQQSAWYLKGQYRLARLYEQGLGVKADPQKALNIYSELIASKLPTKNKPTKHQVLLDDDPKLDLLTYQRVGQAIRQAAEKGQADAKYILAQMYFNGWDTKKDTNQAIHILKQAAEQGDKKSAYQLGNIYYEGKFVPKNLTIAANYYKQAANQNHRCALLQLAIMYRDGVGIKQDYLKAIELYTLLSKQGYAGGDIALGNLYYNGMGVKQDYQKARSYWERAAKNNNDTQAQYNLGYLYYKGQGVKVNFQQALHWFRMAAKSSPKAQFVLGQMYEAGTGVTVDKAVALTWYQKAVKGGFREAIPYMMRLSIQQPINQ